MLLDIYHAYIELNGKFMQIFFAKIINNAIITHVCILKENKNGTIKR